MTVARNARMQSKNVLEILTACCVAAFDRTIGASTASR
jgi:hypothetical protein